LYDIRPGNGAGQFLQPGSPHGAFGHTENVLYPRPITLAKGYLWFYRFHLPYMFDKSGKIFYLIVFKNNTIQYNIRLIKADRTQLVHNVKR